MEASSEPRHSKKLMLFPDQDRDIISTLQDDILHHILSFVSEKDVVRTSILSKKWLNLRTTSPTIILSDKPSSTNRIGLQVVSRALNQHDPSDIKLLALVLSSPVDLYHLESWIHTATTHNVQRLILKLNSNDEQLEFPVSIFNCQSLVEMKLIMKIIMKAPENTQLSRLTCLHLNKVIFDSCSSVKRLLNNCPVLEQLKLVNCEWESVRSVGVIMPMLRTLIIEQNIAQGNILCCVCFTAPKLTSYKCCSNLRVAFCFDGQSSLEYAYIDLKFGSEDVIETACITRLLLDIQNVKRLSISENTLWFIFSSAVEIPTFYSLTQVEFNTTFTLSLISEFMRFLDKSPGLETLDLSKGMVMPGHVYFVRDIIPSCLNSCLKKIHIGNYEAREDEWFLIKFILKNATALESMHIYFSDQLTRDREKLQNFLHRVKNLKNRRRVSERLNIYYSARNWIRSADGIISLRE